MISFFHKLSDKKNLKPFFVIDVETWGLQAKPSKFALGYIYSEHFEREFFSVNEMKSFLLNERCLTGGYIFAHNAQYDYSAIFGNIITGLDNEAIFNGSTFICANNESKDRTFCDSLNIFKTSVDELGKYIGVEKKETPEKFKLGIKSKITKQDIDYIRRDCLIVYKALKDIFTYVGEVKMTISSLSLSLFRRKYLKGKILFNKKLVSKFFDSYYGGRVECFKIGRVIGHKYDVNSMYPYVMSYIDFPNPKNLHLKKNLSIKNSIYFINNRYGMGKFTVYHKKNKFGYLPFKNEKNKVIFPVGTFTGCWNFNELKFALENKMIEIKKCFYVVYSKEKIETPFKQFVNDLYNKRKNSKNEFEKYLIKCLMNSLYGKFAERIKSKTIYFESENEKFVKLIDKCERKNIPYKISYFSKKRKDFYLEIFGKPKLKSNTIPSFSSYITSQARIELLKLMNSFKDNLLYVDTDCVVLNEQMKINSNELGKLKRENEIITEIIGNKHYKFVTKDNVEKLKLKGVSKNYVMIDNKYSFIKMIKTKESLRRQIDAGDFITVEKFVNNSYDKRTVNDDGSTEILVVE